MLFFFFFLKENNKKANLTTKKSRCKVEAQRKDENPAGEKGTHSPTSLRNKNYTTYTYISTLHSGKKKVTPEASSNIVCVCVR